MHYRDRPRSMNIHDFTSSFGLPNVSINFNSSSSLIYDNNNQRNNVNNSHHHHSSTLVQPTPAIFQTSSLLSQQHEQRHHRHHPYGTVNNNSHLSSYQQRILAGDVQEIMKRRLLKSPLTAPTSSSYNNGTMASGHTKNGERLTLPTINVENEVNARTLDMLNRAQLTANLSSINEQYEQILTQLLQPYYQTLPPSMLLLNRSPVVADPSQQQQHIMRPHVSTVSCKSIPHADNPVNLEGFRHKRPIDWSMEDVWSWMVSFAEQRKISADYLNMGNFVNCTGMKLITLSKRQFVDMDENYGEALYEEFRQLAGFDYATFDDVIRANGFSAAAARRRSPPAATPPYGTSFVPPSSTSGDYDHDNNDAVAPSSSSSRQTLSSQHQRRYLSGDDASAPPDAAHCSRPSTSDGNTGGGGRSIAVLAAGSGRRHVKEEEGAGADDHLQRMSSASTPTSFRLMAAFGDKDRDSVIKTAGCDNGPIAVPGGFNANVSSALQRKLKYRQEQQQAAAAAAAAATTFLENFVSAGQCPSKFPYGRICKKPKPGQDDVILTASGKPRKRSQHTKGNKLWEFMRDALKDPETCPSIVKWEDPEQGVFRIVESERLARLWGKKKNNQKMTYEKLSRAMRTYYEKKILEPVPKTGLYPKKLVYKFGPCSHGWQTSASLSMPNKGPTPAGGNSLMAAAAGVNSLYFGGGGGSSSVDHARLQQRPTQHPRHQSPVFINDLLMSAAVAGAAGANCLEPTAAAANLNLLTGCSSLSNFHSMTQRSDTASDGGQMAAAQAAQLNFEMAAAAAIIFSQFNAAAAVAAANSPTAAASDENAARNSRRNVSVVSAAAGVGDDGDGRRCGHQVVVDVKAENNNGSQTSLETMKEADQDDDDDMELKVADDDCSSPSALNLAIDEDQC